MRLRDPLLVLILCGALSACSLSSEETGSAPDVPDGAHRGGILKVGITTPGGIDPLNAYEPAGKLVSSTMCDTMVSLDPVTGQVREALAKGWVQSADGQLTIKSRHGVRFNDGSELKGKDVNFSLQQLVAPANGAYTAGLGQQFFSADSLKKVDVLADEDSSQADIATTVNAYDFQLVAGPNGGALRSFAEPAMAPVSRAAYDKDAAAFAKNPVCVGPYKLEKPYTTGDPEIRMARVTGYYGKNNGYTGGGSGYPDEIVFTIYATAKAALAGYEAGKVDVVQLPRAEVASTKDPASLVLGPATATEFLGLPTGSNGSLSDPDVRVALSQSIDRQKLVETVFGRTTQVATGFEPTALAITSGPSLAGKTIKGAPLRSCGDQAPATPDLGGARAHLAKAQEQPGATKLTGFTLEVNNDAPYPALAKELAAQWKAGLGIDVKVVTTPWSAYVSKATEGTGFTTPFRIRWSTDATTPLPTYNSQQSYLAPLLIGDATAYGNWAHWNDRSFEFGFTEDAGKLTDVQQGGIAFAKLVDIACSQMPIIPLVVDRPAFLVRSTAIGSARTVPVGRDGVLLLRELYLR